MMCMDLLSNELESEFVGNFMLYIVSDCIIIYLYF